jgi:hypothetical protein
MKFQELLLEASKYDAMFDKILSGKLEFVSDDLLKIIKENIFDEIEWARSFLKKEDRIVWYLRLIKIDSLQAIYRRYPEDKDIENTFPDEADNQALAKEKKAISRDLEKTKNKANIRDTYNVSLRTIKQNLIHYLGQDIPNIRDYTFSNESPEILFDKLDDLEEEWKAKIGTEAVKIQPDDKIILKFDGNMAWWLLDRGGCREEGDAMGHCGNVPSQKSGDRILSFRTQIDGDYWKPHLTFILHDNGYLGEMKGRGNEKPAEKYHPYIIALLKKQNLIKGIKDGGYLPQNNFSLNDLDESEREDLVQMNPNLMSVFEKYRKDGPTNEILLQLEDKLAESSLPDIDMIKEKKVFLDSWDDLERFANDLDIEPLIELVKKIENEEDLFSDSIRNSEIEDLADEMDVSPDVYYDIIERIPDNTLSKIASDLNLDVDVSGFNGKKEIADNIDKSNYGYIIRKAIIKTQDFSDQSIKNDPKLEEYIELIFDIISRSSRNYYGYLEYDKNNIFETELKYSMLLDEFVNILEESFNDGDDYEDEEAYMIYVDVSNEQNWMGIDSWKFKNSLEELTKDSQFSDFSDEQKELYREFRVKIDKTAYDLKNIKPVDVAREAIKEIQFNESAELERIKMLAGI